MTEKERNLILTNLQLFADDNNADEKQAQDEKQAEVSAEERVAELEKQLAERENALAESEKKYGKLKGTLDTKLKELGDMTKKERERMSAEELERKEIEEIKEQNAMLLKEREIVGAERRFIQSGCDADTANEGAKALIDGDFDTLFKVIDKMIESKVASEKSELLKTMPKPQGGSSKAGMTREQFNRLGYKERVELLEKDPETYNKFTQ